MGVLGLAGFCPRGANSIFGDKSPVFDRVGPRILGELRGNDSESFVPARHDFHGDNSPGFLSEARPNARRGRELRPPRFCHKWGVPSGTKVCLCNVVRAQVAGAWALLGKTLGCQRSLPRGLIGGDLNLEKGAATFNKKIGRLLEGTKPLVRSSVSCSDTHSAADSFGTRFR